MKRTITHSINAYSFNRRIINFEMILRSPQLVVLKMDIFAKSILENGNKTNTYEFTWAIHSPFSQPGIDYTQSCEVPWISLIWKYNSRCTAYIQNHINTDIHETRHMQKIAEPRKRIYQSANILSERYYYELDAEKSYITTPWDDFNPNPVLIVTIIGFIFTALEPM